MKFEKMYSTIDTHVAGEAFRIIIHSSIFLGEKSLKENAAFVKENCQFEKDLLLNEPRGHRGMNGCIVLPSKKADFGLLFLNHDPQLTFQYSGLAAAVTALLETGNLPEKASGVYDIETTEGVFTVKAPLENGEVMKVQMENRSCAVTGREATFITALVDASRHYYIYELSESVPSLEMDYISSIISWGNKTAEELQRNGTEFHGFLLKEAGNPGENSVRSVTFERDGSIIRSPGVDSTFLLYTLLREEIGITGKFTNESIFGSNLTASIVSGEDNQFSIEVKSFVTGIHQFILDEEDPLRNGFLLK
ncbi:proline racemase family protein [Evansella sp. LMS18]|jgi:proline racemase|uniref:proline racemase family protein n=1 Tax=Evansella sp. LMS18 TaxID=2924033 RepID=UPI0020D0BE3F|nr:proline racemase family protein [Evansella sp. LMS18]UTR12005.1 proline racemase family protein [Evansella sp. LMS18]